MVPYGKNGDFIREVREIRVWCGRTFSPPSSLLSGSVLYGALGVLRLPGDASGDEALLFPVDGNHSSDESGSGSLNSLPDDSEVYKNK